MQVHCPSCSTAYEIPPPSRPRRLRCARCHTEWRALPPVETDLAATEGGIASTLSTPDRPSTATFADATMESPGETLVVERDGTAANPVGHAVGARAVPPPPVIGDAVRVPVRSVSQRGPALFWLVLWLVSLAVMAGAVFAAWHLRVAIEHGWPNSLWLFRLFPRGVPA